MQDERRTAEHEQLAGGDDVAILRPDLFLGSGGNGRVFDAFFVERPHFDVNANNTASLGFTVTERSERLWIGTGYGTVADFFQEDSYSTLFLCVRQGGQWYAVAKIKGVNWSEGF